MRYPTDCTNPDSATAPEWVRLRRLMSTSAEREQERPGADERHPEPGRGRRHEEQSEVAGRERDDRDADEQSHVAVARRDDRHDDARGQPHRREEREQGAGLDGRRARDVVQDRREPGEHARRR